MLSPEPMRHLSLVVLADDLEAATRVIAREGVLHLLDAHEFVGELGAVRPYDVRTALDTLDALLRRVDRVGELLRVPAADVAQVPDTDRPPVLPAVAARVDEVEGEVAEWRAREARIADEALRLQGLLRTLRALAPLGLPVQDLRSLRYVHLVSGLLPVANLARLRESLARVPHMLTTGGPPAGDGRVLITALCLRADALVIDRALRSAQCEPLELPPEITGTPADAVVQAEAHLAGLTAAAATVEGERAALATRYGEEIRSLTVLLRRERLLTEARGRMGGSERAALVTGWVPAVVAPRLDRAVRAAVAERCVTEWRDPAVLDEVRQGRIPVPILLRNPVLVRPFEHLVRNYGLPRYGEIEPTPVVAVAFLTMFGFMFGDVGQGAVLFAIGYFMYRRLFRYRDYAIILMECGVFSVGFGLLYGSVFGVEHWLPALWLRPMEDMERLMRAAIGFGVVFLSIGFVLNLWNAVRRRDMAALWERNGILFALAYWVTIGLAVRRLTGGPQALTIGTALLWLAPLLGLILLREPVVAVWTAVREGRRVDVTEVFAALVQAGVEVLDTLIATISNTATFIRLAAFALSHAGLFLATFSVADAIARTAGGTVGALVAIVLGNVLIIALEGVIVSIQSIRLEYYEFFSKFYSGGGAEYRPLRLGPAGPARV